MKNSLELHLRPLFPAMLALALGSSGCRVVGGIFKAGVWTGVLFVGLFVVVIGFALTRLFRRPA